MTGPDPAVAAVRLAVRRSWRHVSAPTVLVACSGGADSLALLAAAVFERRHAGTRVIGVVVDHGLQDDSAAHTARVVEQMAALGADETASIRVTVDAGPRGVEAGAREARYAALAQLAAHFDAGAVLLGHTRDDQAETVLLGLTRGSGGRSIQGMRREFVEGADFRRPLLDLTREQTRAACRAEGIAWWEDPHNADPRFVRARIRHTVLPVLEEQLGPGVAAALARTGDSVRDDVAALDAWADEVFRGWRIDDAEGLWLRVDGPALVELPIAVRTRVIRAAALAVGALPSDLTRRHVLQIEDSWSGAERRTFTLPGGVQALVGGGSPALFRPATATDT